MGDTEKVVRRIVAQGDINIITKRLVRTEYMKLTGTVTLSADTRKAINAALNKIVAEIALTMRPGPDGTDIDDKMLPTENPSTDNVISQSSGKKEEMIQNVPIESLVSQKEETKTHNVPNKSLIHQKDETRTHSVPMQSSVHQKDETRRHSAPTQSSDHQKDETRRHSAPTQSSDHQKDETRRHSAPTQSSDHQKDETRRHSAPTQSSDHQKDETRRHSAPTQSSDHQKDETRRHSAPTQSSDHQKDETRTHSAPTQSSDHKKDERRTHSAPTQSSVHQKDETRRHSAPTQSSDHKKDERTLSVPTQSSDHQKDETRRHSAPTQMFIIESTSEVDKRLHSSPATAVNSSSKQNSTEKTFVLAHPLCNNKVSKPRQPCTKSRQTKHRMTASEALVHVLNSDDTGSDNSRSEFFDTPQKNTAVGDTWLEELKVKGSPGRAATQSGIGRRGVSRRSVKRKMKTCDFLNNYESSDLDLDLFPEEQNKTPDLHFHNTCNVNIYQNLLTANSSPKSDSERDVILSPSDSSLKLVSENNVDLSPLNLSVNSVSERNVDMLPLNLSLKSAGERSVHSSPAKSSFNSVSERNVNLLPSNSIRNSASERNVDLSPRNSNLNSPSKRTVNLSPSVASLNVCSETKANLSSSNSSMNSVSERNVDLSPLNLSLKSLGERSVPSLLSKSGLNSVSPRNVDLSPSNSNMDSAGERNVALSPRNSNLNSVSERNVHHFYKELYSKSGISDTTERSCSKSGPLSLLSRQKLRQDCLVDSSSDNYDSHLPDANVFGNMEHNKEVVCVSGSSSDNESYTDSCSWMADSQQRHQADGGGQRQAAERVLVSTGKGLDSSSSASLTDAFFANEVTSVHQEGFDHGRSNSAPVIQIESTTCLDSPSNDSGSPFRIIQRKARFKIRARKRIFDDSESDCKFSGSPQNDSSYRSNRIDSNSDFQQSDSPHKSTTYQPKHIDSDSDLHLSGSPQKNTLFKPKRIDSDSDFHLSGSPEKNNSYKSKCMHSDFCLSDSNEKNKSYKPKRNGRDAIVMIKTVDAYSSDVEVIKYAVVSDSEILENIENKAQRKFSSRKRRERNLPVKIKKQKLKTVNSEICTVDDYALDKSLENFPSSQSLNLSHDLSQTSKSQKSSIYDLSDDDEFNVPLSELNSYRNYKSRRSSSEGNRAYSYSVVISNQEKEIIDHVQNNSFESSSWLDPKLKGFHLNSVSDNICESSQHIPLIRQRQTTEFRKKDCSDLPIVTTSSPNGYDSNCDEPVSSSVADIPDSSDSEDSSSRLPDRSSSGGGAERRAAHSTSSKLCHNTKLAKLRLICQRVGLILRNTVELAGCSTDSKKAIRIKQLLNERGMPGEPSLKKVEKMNLLREIKELQGDEMKELHSDKITLSSHTEGRRIRKMSVGTFENSNDSCREHQNMIHANDQDVFSELKDVIVIDDSD